MKNVSRRKVLILYGTLTKGLEKYFFVKFESMV